MRIWFLGSTTQAASAGLISPAKALLRHLGSRVGSVTPGAGYPFAISDDRLCEIAYRHKKYLASYSYDMTGVSGGDTYRYTATGSGNLVLDPSITSERQLIGEFDNGFQGGWQADGAGFMIHQVARRNGTIIAESDTPLEISFRHAYNAGENSEDEVRYFYGTDDKLWLPSMWLHTGPTFAVQHANSLGTVVPGVGYATVTRSALFDGGTLAYDVAILDYLTVTNFSLSIDPVEWWEYRRANGAEAIWDATTGVQLRTPITQIF
jgi:hypothetical protein